MDSFYGESNRHGGAPVQRRRELEGFGATIMFERMRMKELLSESSQEWFKFSSKTGLQTFPSK